MTLSDFNRTTNQKIGPPAATAMSDFKRNHGSGHPAEPSVCLFHNLVCDVPSLLHAHNQNLNANANSYEHMSMLRAHTHSHANTNTATHAHDTFKVLKKMSCLFWMTCSQQCGSTLRQKKINTTAVTPPGPAEIWSGPVETEFQGRLRSAAGAGPAVAAPVHAPSRAPLLLSLLLSHNLPLPRVH
jgi:hypothetical protein